MVANVGGITVEKTKARFEETPEKTKLEVAKSPSVTEEEVLRCPVCYHPIPAEQMGAKLHCRRCGYLESCCNPY
jgi:Zn finger protein HypA/HybF involved in hydrogenase expression